MLLISTFGSGLLVGTALIVIIPEGIETLYHAEKAHLDQIPLARATEPEDVFFSDQRHDISSSSNQVFESKQLEQKPIQSQDEEPHFHPQKNIGAALIFGYAFMFIIEQVGHLGHKHSHIAVSELRETSNSPTKRTSATIG
jgi:zinc transporter 9